MRGLALGIVVLAGCLGSGGSANAPVVGAAKEASEAAVPVPVPVTAPATVTAPVPATAMDAREVVCARAVRCGTIGRSQLDECREGPGVSRLTLVWGYDDKLGIPALLADGRMKAVPGAEQVCLDWLARSPCAVDSATAPRGCERGGSFHSLAPAVAPGGKCTRWGECVDGHCTARPGCEGVCVATMKLGESCGADRLCGGDTFCWEGTCRARAGVGAECGGHWQWCQDGLFCDGYRPAVDSDPWRGSERRGRCSAGKRLGEGCVPPKTAIGEVCAAGLYCDWGSDAPVCRTPAAAGETCGWLDACGDGLVCAGLVLGGSHPAGGRLAARTRGRCTPTLDAGEACDPAAFLGGCPASMVCDPERRVCRSTGHAGDPCVSSWITKPRPPGGPLRTAGCFSSHYCDVATRTCKPQLARGERCTPQPFGVEDEPCFLGKCDARTRRCAAKCK